MRICLIARWKEIAQLHDNVKKSNNFYSEHFELDDSVYENWLNLQSCLAAWRDSEEREKGEGGSILSRLQPNIHFNSRQPNWSWSHKSGLRWWIKQLLAKKNILFQNHSSQPIDRRKSNWCPWRGTAWMIFHFLQKSFSLSPSPPCFLKSSSRGVLLALTVFSICLEDS